MPKTVVITGASSGFGKEVALLFKENGWNVAATMRTPEKAEAWVRPARLFRPPLEVMDLESMKNAVDLKIEKFDQIDALINHAGFALMGPLERASQADLR